MKYYIYVKIKKDADIVGKEKYKFLLGKKSYVCFIRESPYGTLVFEEYTKDMPLYYNEIELS